MSIQFGIWNLDGRPVDVRVIQAADSMLEPYASDGVSQYNSEGTALVHHALHTTAESRHEKQPYISNSGVVIMWDGRLDNREELVRNLAGDVSIKSTDVEIVAASFDRWDTGCFAKLIGDWAVTIWNPCDRLLILAKDFVGIRPLYYLIEGDQIWWSSVLDPLVKLSRKTFGLNHEYAAGWLAMYPATDTTPYAGISAVPACSYVSVHPESHTVVKYWDFDPGKRIGYRSDTEYEDHFRILFREAVRRRLRSDRPICAELSGGMDSPSITCMADLIADSSSGIPLIKTISFYDDLEPSADERPYFTAVEEKRGISGCHIDVSGREIFTFAETDHFEAMPASTAERTDEIRRQYASFLQSNSIRVVLSGVGGDEFMGGVPTPISELQDLFQRAQFRHLARKLRVWAIDKRKPWFHLFAEALAGFLPNALVPNPRHRRPAPWLTSDFVERNRDVLGGFEKRLMISGPLPSFQANLNALATLRRQLATRSLPTEPAHEKRYPFLDRTLLEFIFAIPREQLVRPGQRRSLMRRGLAGIVPPEILGRRRKAYVSRAPRVAISKEWDRLSILSENMVCSSLGIVDEACFREALLAVRNSGEVPLVRLLRTVILEVWLRSICGSGMLLGLEREFATDGEKHVIALPDRSPNVRSVF
jgi:asparagine synthase (glutamine-hydrolysing)